MGTVDNCKKAESLISAKLRASYENDMAHLIPVSFGCRTFTNRHTFIGRLTAAELIKEYVLL